MRPLNEVLEVIKKVVPKDFTKKEELSNSLDNISNSSMYAAPEVMHLWWSITAGSLQYYLGTPDTTWKKKIADIFGDKINYKEV